MDFGLFGIGLPQILFIFVVALIVFGPEKLPGIARQAGRYVNELRRMTQEARSEIQTLTKDLEIKEELKQVQSDLMEIRRDLTSTGQDLIKDFQDIRKEVDLRDTSGNLMGKQLEQSTYSVQEIPSAVEGAGALVVEETIRKETIIQEAVTNEPATGTESVTVTTGAIEETAQAAVESEAVEATLAGEPAFEVETVEATLAGEPVLETEATAGNEHVIQPAESLETPAYTAEPVAPTPEPEPLPSEELVVVGATEQALSNGSASHYSNGSFFQNGTQPGEVELLRQEVRSLEVRLESNQRDYNQRLEEMERRLFDRMDHVEKLLAGEFMRIHRQGDGS
ncbi:MAG TPA: twin-arginine translocase TatA/TatE family subunit [Chloroflexia bacterium]|nr:twin-arginine translocase TatA/TatE family subunit [Chloroflexia bacterium]